MNIQQTEREILFKTTDAVAGVYVLNDPYKPHFRELNTPAGHNLVLVSPADHRHHKGLMFALKCADVNFWEEEPDSGHCGIQEIVSTTIIENEFRQELLWREEQGGLHTYREIRTITCEVKKSAFEWTWKSHRTALRDHQLVVSHWLLEVEDGRKINYHGLGVRLPWGWVWGGPKGDPDHFGTIEMNGKPTTQNEASGSTARSVGLVGLIDGHWNPPRAALTITQDQQLEYGWFALREGFPYLSVGPSILGSMEVTQDQTFNETYIITVENR